jgi:hypothetical protein
VSVLTTQPNLPKSRNVYSTFDLSHAQSKMLQGAREVETVVLTNWMRKSGTSDEAVEAETLSRGAATGLGLAAQQQQPPPRTGTSGRAIDFASGGTREYLGGRPRATCIY